MKVATVSFFYNFATVLKLLSPCDTCNQVTIGMFGPICVLNGGLLRSMFSRFGGCAFCRMSTSILDITSFIVTLLAFVVVLFLT